MSDLISKPHWIKVSLGCLTDDCVGGEVTWSPEGKFYEPKDAYLVSWDEEGVTIRPRSGKKTHKVPYEHVELNYIQLKKRWIFDDYETPYEEQSLVGPSEQETTKSKKAPKKRPSNENKPSKETSNPSKQTTKKKKEDNHVDKKPSKNNQSESMGYVNTQPQQKVKKKPSLGSSLL